MVNHRAKALAKSQYSKKRYSQAADAAYKKLSQNEKIKRELMLRKKQQVKRFDIQVQPRTLGEHRSKSFWQQFS